jgi:hypothetical protein
MYVHACFLTCSRCIDSHTRAPPSDTVDASARLIAVLWLLAADAATPAEGKKILEASHFKSGSSKLGFDDVVPGGKAVLTLVMCTSSLRLPHPLNAYAPS